MNPGIDLSCAKKVVIGDPTPGTCGGGQSYDAGLCYPSCQSGYNGVGPVCWGVCPNTYPVRCGMGCAKTQDACAQNTTDQVMSVLEAVANVGLEVATAGASTAATTGAKAGLGMSKAGAKFAGNVTKSTVKSTIVQYGKKIGKDIAENAAETYAQAVTQAGTTGEFDPSVLAGLDPTGIASIVVAYTKPVCTPPPANTPPAATRVASTGDVKLATLTTTPVWSRAAGSIPANAVIGGQHANGSFMPVCRANMGDGTHPGKVWGGKCNVGWGGQERVMGDFEVLVGDLHHVAWVGVSGGPLPPNATIGGRHANGSFMAVCRANMGDGMHPGKVWGGKCNVGWGGQERVMPNFEVLVLK
jgi:hypothetical protein